MIFLRRFIMRIMTRHMKPIPPELAKIYHTRLTFAYLFITFNMLITVVYFTKKHELGKKMVETGDPAHDVAKRLGLTNPTIVRLGASGIKVEKYKVPHDFENK